MAIRMALGSERVGIVRLVLESGVKLAAIGCMLGLACAAAASTLLCSLLFGVSPFDPLVLTAAVLGVLVLALAASMLPAFRAASIEPMQALSGQ
jgi:ABC-type antimicrobial peptide transport system permease subunit